MLLKLPFKLRFVVYRSLTPEDVGHSLLNWYKHWIWGLLALSTIVDATETFEQYRPTTYLPANVVKKGKSAYQASQEAGSGGRATTWDQVFLLREPLLPRMNIFSTSLNSSAGTRSEDNIFWGEGFPAWLGAWTFCETFIWHGSPWLR